MARWTVEPVSRDSPAESAPIPDRAWPGSSGAPPLGDWLEARLLDRRVIWVRGTLDDLVATSAATKLMALDGSGDDPIQLHLNCGDGALSAALTLMDTISALGVPLEAVCAGRAEGPPLGVLAVAHRRLAASHSRLRLGAGEVAAHGSAADLTRELEQHQRQLERFIELVAQATRQPAERVEIDLGSGRYFEPEEAIEYRLIDGVWNGRTSASR